MNRKEFEDTLQNFFFLASRGRKASTTNMESFIPILFFKEWKKHL
ncbi:hypothetical protein [Bacillus paranthracis]|nr:hypothetical protein [Bacillus paranthracis]